ncbi:MAG: hypothetical protein CRN43_19695 [Candidatus Nephrothrix sp. EaCA]|nr:MAG: hypothetical protein CRN43_19695 [Candidatus Nephrothrix sp. EaCA]
MKSKIYKIATSALVFVIISLNSCKNLTDGYSTDPVKITDPSVISISKYLSGIEMSLIAVYEGDLGFYAGIWSNYFSGDDRQFVGFANYILSADYMDSAWRTIYNNILKNHLILEEKAKTESNFRALAISQVTLALAMGLAADLWGDVPYTEAGKYPAALNPKFDSQSSIYAAVQTLLDEAIANLNRNIGTAAGDFFLNGNKAHWINVIHSAKARYYLHTKDYQNAIAHGLSGIAKADENLMAPHGNIVDKNYNTYYSFLAQGQRVGYMLANCYAPALLDPAKTATYRGNRKTDESARLWWYYAPGGLSNRSAAYEPNYSCPEYKDSNQYSGFFGSRASFPLVTFEETKLILAEAYMKQSAPDPDKALSQLNLLRQYYNTGAPFKSNAFLKKSLKYDDYTLADFAPVGGIANTKGEAQNTALLREILEERYVSLIGQIEGWTDMRRTKNFLGLPLAPGKTDFPKRMIYPQIEVNTNTNTPQGVGLFTDVPSFVAPY